MKHVVDTSAILASLKREPGAALVEELIDECAVSTVNLAEIATVLTREGSNEAFVYRFVASIPAMAIAPDVATAADAGVLSGLAPKAGLSLGDRFCLALARRLRLPVLTADREWALLADALRVEVRLIR